MITIKKAFVDNIANIKKDVEEMVKAIVQIKWMRTQLLLNQFLRLVAKYESPKLIMRQLVIL